MTRRLLPILLIALASVIAVAGCGGSGDSAATTSAEASTPEEALAELATIRTLLEKAVAQYRAGDAEAAEETVGDAYLEHYEHVEGPLGERDHDLMERIEEILSTDLREQIKDGKPADEVADAVDELNGHLDEAETALA